MAAAAHLWDRGRDDRLLCHPFLDGFLPADLNHHQRILIPLRILNIISAHDAQ